MMDWSQWKSSRVLEWFEQICGIPHGSGNTKEISDFCVAFARERGLAVRQDEWNNVVIVREADSGMEDRPPVMLQAHLDMVCEKEREFDFTRDGLDLEVQGEELFARGTTLGGDNGIGVALILTLLEGAEVPLPRIEGILTVDEETGMDGAEHLDLSSLQATHMINLDSEEEGVFTVGCAGGEHLCWQQPVTRQTIQGAVLRVNIEGLTGGHSGTEIGRGGGSAIHLLGQLLETMGKAAEFSLSTVFGGTQSNAIPRGGECELVCMPEAVPLLRQRAEALIDRWRQQYADTDPKLLVSITEETGERVCMSRSETDRLISLLSRFPFGVIRRDSSGQVQTSLNLGVLRTCPGEVTGLCSVRANRTEEIGEVMNRLTDLCAQTGARIRREGAYPAWERAKSSPLCQKMMTCYEELFSEKATVTVIHAGLECGLFAKKIPGFDCVSIGPDLREIHTVRERLSLPSLDRLWRFLLQLFQNWG